MEDKMSEENNIDLKETNKSDFVSLMEEPVERFTNTTTTAVPSSEEIGLCLKLSTLMYFSEFKDELDGNLIKDFIKNKLFNNYSYVGHTMFNQIFPDTENGIVDLLNEMRNASNESSIAELKIKM